MARSVFDCAQAERLVCGHQTLSRVSRRMKMHDAMMQIMALEDLARLHEMIDNLRTREAYCK